MRQATSAAAILGILTISTVLSRAQEPFRAGVDLVRLPVIVLGPDGAPVAGLAASDFDVLEGGEPQQVVSFAVGGSDTDVPLHLGLMLDKSESMELDLARAAEGAVTFIDLLTEARDVTYVEFDARVGLGRYGPSNYLRLFERIRDPAMGARTVLYDAMAYYLETTIDRPGQHVLVVYTDGGDSGSTLNATDVRELLRWGNVVLYAIGYLDHQSAPARARQRGVLTQLARETGGEAFFPSSSDDLDRIYEQIRREIEGRYTIGYAPQAPVRAGEFRRVEVRLRAPDTDDVAVRTRTGYIVVGRP